MSDTDTSKTGSTAPDDTKGKAPKFDGEFDAERAARLIENLRADLDKIKSERDEARATLTSKEDAEKSEVEKAVARAERAEAALKAAQTEAARATVARKHEIPDDLLPFLTGETPEDMEKAAEALAKYAGKSKESKDEEENLPGKPKARLVAGHETDERTTDAFDPEKIAAAIRSNDL